MEDFFYNKVFGRAGELWTSRGVKVIGVLLVLVLAVSYLVNN